MTSFSKGFGLRRAALLLATAAPIALAAGGAQAQEIEASAAIGAVEEIVITASPIRDSLVRSLEAQRSADNIVSVIAADTIGRFPDQTSAGALARLPGIAVQRDQGQERYIQVRGAPTNWTVVSFDGINVLGAEDRIFRFDSVPAALISAVELDKTLTPAMPAEALSGRVNIETYSALANPGFHALVDAGYGKLDLGDGPQEQLAARLSWGNDKFGVVLTGSHFQFEQQTDNAEPRFDAIGVRELRNAKYIIVRETNSLFGKLEYAPSDEHKIRFSSLYTEFLDHEERHQYTFNFAGAASGTRTNTSASLVGVPVVGAFEKGEYATSTFVNTLHGDHDVSGWKVGWDLAYTRTKSLTDLPIISQSQSNQALRPSLTYTRGSEGLDGIPVVSLFDTVRNASGTLVPGAARSTLDQTAFDTEILSPYGMTVKTEAYTAKGDLARDWSSFGADSTFRTGFQYDDRTSKDPGALALVRPNGTTGSLSLRPTAAALGVAYNPANFVTSNPVDEDFNRGYVFNYLDNEAWNAALNRIVDAARAANGAGTYALPGVNPATSNQVSEKIIAGYAQNTWRTGRHTLLAGVRVEHTKTDSQGLAIAGAVLAPVEVSRSKTMVFPSVHYSFDATDSLKLRAAFISGAARPSFTDLRANVTINDTVGFQSIGGGNPDLQPERAYGGDASIEWYFAPGALLSASAFYRDVKDVIFDASAPVGDSRFDFGGVNRSLYQYSTPRNGDGGNIKGVEFTYYHPFTFLPGVLAGFGFQGSLALLDGEFTLPNGRELGFPGTSDRITNLSLFYEKYGLSARISWQHRTEWLDTVGTSALTDIYWAPQQRVDLSVRYQINDYLTVYGDANNLTDELGVRYEGSKSRPYEVEGFGRRFMIGLRATF